MRYRVMLADDEPIMRKALLTLTDWEKIGCEVIYTVKNGEEALKQLEEDAPDILVTDIRMPGADGIELARYIWEHKLPTKVIILTAYADFSYAQSAVKYGVVDYVTKTGAFEALIAAIELAKEKIQTEQQSTGAQEMQQVVKNLLKSVFDGSFYEEDAMREEFARLHLKLGSYLVLLVQFQIGEERQRRGLKEINRSLENFFSMSFGAHMIQAVPVEKNMFAVLLTEMKDGYIEYVRSQCGQIIDMMDNFMKLRAYIGAGDRHFAINELRMAYQEARRAVGYGFIPEEGKVHFYRKHKDEIEVYPAELEQQTEKICMEIRKGNVTGAADAFRELTILQKQFRCPEHMIKNAGITIQGRCRRILAEYDRTIYEVSGITESISHSIYGSRHIEEYERLMLIVIEKSAEAVYIAANRKEALVYECQKYIDEHYEETLPVTEIARAIGTSASYLSRIFKEATGQTIIYTLNQKKMKKAKEYIRNTDMKIYEIADCLGFENATYFSHFFKKYEGISPKDYKGDTT